MIELRKEWYGGMDVKIISCTGEVRTGRATFSNGRRKMRSVGVVFEEPVWVPYDRTHKDGYSSRGLEFYLADHGHAIMVWGQGEEFPRDTWTLDPAAAAEILAGGGG